MSSEYWLEAIRARIRRFCTLAHYDHLGFVAGMAGDNIYNGAADNATGCGMLLEMARAWTASGLKTPHSVIFSAVTAEEQGLLGSEYLGQHPPVPAGQIALDINYDMILPDWRSHSRVNRERRPTNGLFSQLVEATAKRFSLDDSSRSAGPLPAATIAPITSASLALGYRHSRYRNRNSCMKGTMRPGDRKN